MSWNKSETFLQSSTLSLHLLLYSIHRFRIVKISNNIHIASIHIRIEKFAFRLFFFSSLATQTFTSDKIDDRNAIQKLFVYFVKWQYGTIYLLVPKLIYIGFLFIIVVSPSNDISHSNSQRPNILLFCSNFLMSFLLCFCLQITSL